MLTLIDFLVVKQSVFGQVAGDGLREAERLRADDAQFSIVSVLEACETIERS
jgi:hypothetical protein